MDKSACFCLAPGRSSQRGVTLVELLASMVIFSLCVALMSNAFFQVQRLLGVVERSRDPASPGPRLVGSLQEAVGSLVARDTDAKPFSGDAQTFVTTTSRHPLGPGGLPQLLQMSLVRAQQGSGLRIGAARPVDGGFGTVKSVVQPVVLELPHAASEPVRWVYQARDGLLFDRWPVAQRESEQLPSAVWLISSGPGLGDAWPLQQAQLGVAGRSRTLAVWTYGGPPGWMAQNSANPFTVGGGSGAPVPFNPFGK